MSANSLQQEFEMRINATIDNAEKLAPDNSASQAYIDLNINLMRLIRDAVLSGERDAAMLAKALTEFMIDF